MALLWIAAKIYQQRAVVKSPAILLLLHNMLSCIYQHAVKPCHKYLNCNDKVSKLSVAAAFLVCAACSLRHVVQQTLLCRNERALGEPAQTHIPDVHRSKTDCNLLVKGPSKLGSPMVIIGKLVSSEAPLTTCLSPLVITFDSFTALFEACYLPSYTRASSLQPAPCLGCKSLQLPQKQPRFYDLLSLMINPWIYVLGQRAMHDQELSFDSSEGQGRLLFLYCNFPSSFARMIAMLCYDIMATFSIIYIDINTTLGPFTVLALVLPLTVGQEHCQSGFPFSAQPEQ